MSTHDPPLSDARRTAIPATHVLTLLALGCAAIVSSHALDYHIYHTWTDKYAINSDFWRALRAAGYAPLWLVVAVAAIYVDAQRPLQWPLRSFLTRGVLLALSASVAGTLAEFFKLTIRRERPNLSDGLYVFRDWNVPAWWSTSNLGLPSSHVAVCFGAVTMLIMLHPRLRALWVAIGIGCAAQRVISGAHFFSDAVLGAVLGSATAVLLWNMHMRPRQGDSSVHSSKPEGRSGL